MYNKTDHSTTPCKLAKALQRTMNRCLEWVFEGQRERAMICAIVYQRARSLKLHLKPPTNNNNFYFYVQSVVSVFNRIRKYAVITANVSAENAIVMLAIMVNFAPSTDQRRQRNQQLPTMQCTLTLATAEILHRQQR